MVEALISLAHWQQPFHMPGQNHARKKPTDSILGFLRSVAAVATITPFNVLYCVSQ